MFNKNIRKQAAVITVVLLSMFTFNGCILDAFNTLIQELPFTTTIHLNTTATLYEETTSFDLNENEFYSNNQANINSIQLVKIAYKTSSVSPSDLTGTITLTVKQANGVILFSKVIPGNRPSDYTVNPYELTLTQSEIQLVNAYLSILTNRQFIATVKIETSVADTKTLDADIFTVFTMDYDL